LQCKRSLIFVVFSLDRAQIFWGANVWVCWVVPATKKRIMSGIIGARTA